MIKLKSLINEIEFATQKAFDTYAKNHKLRPDTKVKIAGKTTTAGAASKVKGTSVFGGGEKKKEDPMATVNTIASKTGLRPQAVAGWADENGVNLSALVKDIQSKKLKPMDVMTAVSGNPQNKYAQQLVSKYSNKPSVSDLGVDAVVYNKRTNTVGIVRLPDERGETKTDADGNVNTDELEPFNPMKYPHQKNAQVAPSTKKEIDDRGLWKPFSQQSSNKADLKKTVNKIAKLTDTNQHTNAVIELAKMIGDEKAVKQLQKIDAQHMKIGSMPMNLINKRRDIRTALLNTAKEKYGEEGYNKLKGSF